MKEIQDKNRLEKAVASQRAHFGTRPPVLRLLSFEKGELLYQPLKPIDQFLLILDGSIIVYHLSSEGDIRYLSRSGCGALLGDMEFCGAERQILYVEAVEPVQCLSIPFQENRSVLENDPTFLRFVLQGLSGKLFLSSKMDAMVQTLEEKVLLYVRKMQPEHEIRSVNETMQFLHCSRRQLQRVLKKLCEDGLLVKTNRGHYQLNE